MKRQIVFAFVVLLLASPASATSIFFSPAFPSVTIGSDVVLDLNIAGLGNGAAPSVGVFDLDVTFDDTLLSYQSVTWGTGLDVLGLGSLHTATIGIGTLNLFELSLDTVPDLNALQPATFTLATLRFTSLAVGDSVLAVLINSLGDADGNALDVAIETAHVSVQDGAGLTPIPEPATLGMLALGILCGSLARIRQGLRSC